jgi:hypothetical protein
VQIIRPFTIDSTSLASSSVPETPPTAYNAGTTYAEDDIATVFTGTAGIVYLSLQNSNTGNTPASSPLFWLAIGDTYALYSGSTLYVLGDVVISTTTHREYESLSGVSLGTMTVTIASPGVVTSAGHGLIANTPVLITTTGALPTGLSAGTIYYVRNPATDTFELSATSGGASINTSVSQSGVHTLYSNPNKGFALDDDAHWLDRGADNRWRMFDQSNSSETSAPEEIDVSVDVIGRADSVSLLNITAATVQIIVTTDADGEIYNQTFDLVSDSGVTDWYAYFFEPIIRRSDLVVTDLPANADPNVQVIMLEPGGDTVCGTMVIGQSFFLGDTVYGAKLGIQDYSRKVADDFGNFSIVERAFSKRATFKVVIQNTRIDAIMAFLTSLRAIPVVYRGTDEFASTYIYGFFRDFSVEIAYVSQSYCNLEIEGLT